MKKRFEVLDAFRGICALCVVLFHMRLVGSVTELAFFRGSNIFVDFFFVLSGFVLAHGYGFKDNLGFAPFMKARFFRLYPLHLFMLVVFVALEFAKLAAVKFGGFSFNDAPFSGATAITEIVPNLLLVQSWTPFTDHLSFNYPSWSISIEFYVYAIMFMTVAFAGRFKILSWFSMATVMFALVAGGSGVLVEPVLTGLSCFFAGAGTYVFYKKFSDFTPPRFIASITELLLLCAVVWVVQSGIDYRDVAAGLLFCLVVLMFAFEAGVFSQALKLKPFQMAGKLSYSIYMTHAAILFCLISVAMVLQKMTGITFAPMKEGGRYLTSGNAVLNNVLAVFILMLVMAVSYVTYRFIEIKGQALGKRLRWRTPAAASV